MIGRKLWQDHMPLSDLLNQRHIEYVSNSIDLLVQAERHVTHIELNLI